MSSDRHYLEERLAHRVTVDGFLIDETPVTNAQFFEFVAATNYHTFAETVPDSRDHPGILPDMLHAGSLASRIPDKPVTLDDCAFWWSFLEGANWRHLYGPRSSIKELEDHPVLHISYRDALAYAQWRGKDLPTEAEWELAASGGLDRAEFAWGAELTPGGRHMANTWQEAFPNVNHAQDGYVHTSPVRTVGRRFCCEFLTMALEMRDFSNLTSECLGRVSTDDPEIETLVSISQADEWTTSWSPGMQPRDVVDAQRLFDWRD